MSNLNLQQITENIGNNIVAYRKLLKLNQTDFAKQLGVSRPALASYEELRSIPKITTLIRFSDLIDSDIKTIATKKIFQEGGSKNG